MNDESGLRLKMRGKSGKSTSVGHSFHSVPEAFVKYIMQLAFYDSAAWEMHLQARFRRHYLSPSHRKQAFEHVPLKLTFATSAVHDRES